MRKNVQIGSVLVNKGYITKDQLKQAIELQKKEPGKRLGDILEELSYVSEEVLAESLAEQLDFPFVELDEYHIDPKAVTVVDQGYARQRGIIPIEFRGDMLVVAASDPLAFYTFEELQSMTGYGISTVVATKSAVGRAIDHWYSGSDVRLAVNNLNKELENVQGDEDLAMLDERVEGTPVAKLINATIIQAASSGASDIHIEPTRESLVFRLRINGDLMPHATMKIAAHSAIVTRIKLLSDMNIAEKRIPQDGKFHFSSGNIELDIRASSLPTIYGEKLVLRLMGSSLNQELLNLDKLGMDPGILEQYSQMIKSPNGIILVTGPTGSGKTTTLYATINQLSKRKSNIVTIEDPVEQRIDDVNQVQVNDKAGLTFAVALRSILRQDPDIIMVGEMRDSDTATLGIRAAITGHLVLSTLHTNDTLSSITRMVDMGVAPYMAAAALSGIVAQRLVKVLCPKCRKSHAVTQRDRIILGEGGADIEEVWEPVGCPNCNGTGYIGRRPVYELIRIDEHLRTMIAGESTLSEMKDYEKSKGTHFLRDSVLELVRTGDTTISEMEKIVYSVE